MARFNPETKSELEEDLHRVIRRAYENDVNITDAGMELRYESPEIPDWELMMFQLGVENSDSSTA